MNEDILMDTDKLFEKYFQDGLAIRAICDDLDLPGSYSPVFVNIHVRGADYFRREGENRAVSLAALNILSPERAEAIAEKIEEMDNEDLRERMKKICVGDRLKDLDESLEKGGIAGFFRSQMEALRRMHTDEEFREHMIYLYETLVRPKIPGYDDEKIQRAFRVGRIKDRTGKPKKESRL